MQFSMAEAPNPLWNHKPRTQRIELPLLRSWTGAAFLAWNSCHPHGSAVPGLKHTNMALKTLQTPLDPWKTLQELVLGVVTVTLPWGLQGAPPDAFLGLGHCSLQARTQIPLKTLKK